MSRIQNIEALAGQLSSRASIDHKGDAKYAVTAARWSDLNTPKPGAVVNVANEADVETTIKWAVANNVLFVAQSGGHAWSSWFLINENGIVINMRALNSVEIDLEMGLAVLGGGTTVGEAVRAAKAANAHLAVGTCNSVGTTAGALGGGTGLMMGLHGLGADNVISARLVTATGETLTVSASENADLFWALRGAGHNFGIVTSLTVRAFPEINAGMHYRGVLGFPHTQIGAVVAGLDALDLKPDCSLELLFMRAPPSFEPIVAVSMWHAGSVESARERFAGLFELGGMVVQEHMVSYANLNDHLDPLCAKGGFKPTFSVSFNTLSTEALTAFWTDFVAFSAEPGAGMSVMNIEWYNSAKAHAVPLESTAVGPALRTQKFHGFAAAMYEDPALYSKAREYGDSFRAKMAGTDSGAPALVYANFAFGDETVEALYGTGERLERLKALKLKFDPQGQFSHFVPISSGIGFD